MKELLSQYESQVPIHPSQLVLSLALVSHVVTGKLDRLEPKASSVLNNLFGPSVEFEFPNEEEAANTVIGLLASTLDAFWKTRPYKNAREQQLADNVRSLKRQGLSRDEVIERLSLHFLWGLNS